MILQSFTIKFGKSNIVLKGGCLTNISKINHTKALELKRHELHFICKESSNKKDVEKSILEMIKRKSTSVHFGLILFKWRRLLVTITISLVIIILINLLSIHSSLTFDLFSGNSGNNILNLQNIYIYSVLSIFIIVFLAFSPKIILGHFDNLIDWAKSRFSSTEHVKRRISRKIRLLLKTNNNITEIFIWNPLAKGDNSWIFSELLPVLLDSQVMVNIMIKNDEKNITLQKLSELGFDKYAYNNDKETSNIIEKQYFPVNLLPSWEQEFLQYFIFCSSLNLPDRWSKNSEMQHFVSRALAEIIFDLYSNKVFRLNNQKTTFEKFIERCINDYKYLIINETYNKQNLLLSPILVEVISPELRLETLKDDVINDLNKVSDKLYDPMGYLILLGLLNNESTISPRIIKFIKYFIINIKLSESYYLLSDYWYDINNVETISDGGYQQNIMQFFDVKTLNDFAVCFANSGMYDEAFEVYKTLENIYPAKTSIDIADILDSIGDYKKALEKLFEVDKNWVKNGIIEDDELILELFLNIAWVIVSGRFIEKKDLGYDYLQKTFDTLKKYPNKENYLNYLIRYYNTIANYYEWDERYNDAISNYEKALKLPGNIIRKSSLLVNHGIANRLLGNSLSDVSRKEQHYLKSRSNIKQGVKMKSSIGEKNQLPGSYHNLTETLLELSRVIENDSEKNDILLEAYQTASKGLNLLVELNSTKRKGRLISEKFIASTLLSIKGDNFNLEFQKKELQNWLEEEDENSYDYREVTQLLKRFKLNLISRTS